MKSAKNRKVGVGTIENGLAASGFPPKGPKKGSFCIKTFLAKCGCMSRCNNEELDATIWFQCWLLIIIVVIILPEAKCCFSFRELMWIMCISCDSWPKKLTGNEICIFLWKSAKNQKVGLGTIENGLAASGFPPEGPKKELSLIHISEPTRPY